MKIIELSGMQNSVVKHLIKLRMDPKYRALTNTVPIFGRTMVEDVCPKVKTAKLLVAKGKTQPAGINPSSTYSVSLPILCKISGMKSIDDMIAEVEMPNVYNVFTNTPNFKKKSINYNQSYKTTPSHSIESLLKGKRLVLVVDCISDPGNMGTLIRTAHCFGWDCVCVLDNSVDPFNDKALRGAKGATFFIPIIKLDTLNSLQDYITSNNIGSEDKLFPDVCVFAADPSSSNGAANFELVMRKFSMQQLEIRGAPAPEQIILILGNESRGLSEEAKKISMPLTLPMYGGLNSGLNVGIAGGMFMWLLSRWKNSKFT